MRDVELMADGVIAAVRDFVAKAMAPITRQVLELLETAAALDRRVSALPVPKDGLPGASAFQIACLGGFRGSENEWLESLKGAAGSPGETGEQGIAGKDGTPGEIGQKGDRGEDGLGFDDLSVEYDGARAFTFKFQRGEETKEFRFEMPVLLDCGVWHEGGYSKGDGVTWAGSFWIAQRATTQKPGTDDWRLAVKKGQDGKAGEPGRPGKAGDVGKPGRDLTQMSFDGAKY